MHLMNSFGISKVSLITKLLPIWKFQFKSGKLFIKEIDDLPVNVLITAKKLSSVCTSVESTWSVQVIFIRIFHYCVSPLCLPLMFRWRRFFEKCSDTKWQFFFFRGSETKTTFCQMIFAKSSLTIFLASLSLGDFLETSAHTQNVRAKVEEIIQFCRQFRVLMRFQDDNWSKNDI